MATCNTDCTTDSDSDGEPDCSDLCPSDPNKIEPGECGCGTSCQDFSDDFSTDPFASRWTTVGSWTYESGPEEVSSPTTPDDDNHMRFNTETDQGAQYMRYEIVTRNGDPGFILRLEGVSSGDLGHYVRFDASNSRMAFHCFDSGARQTEHTTDAGISSLTDGDFLCAEITGAKGDPTIKVWKNCDEPRPWTTPPDVAVQPGNACEADGRQLAIAEGGSSSSFDNWTGGDI